MVSKKNDTYKQTDSEVEGDQEREAEAGISEEPAEPIIIEAEMAEDEATGAEPDEPLEIPDPTPAEPPAPALKSRESGLHPFVWALVGSGVSLAVLVGIYAVESRPDGLFDNNSTAIAALEQRIDAVEGALTGQNARLDMAEGADGTLRAGLEEAGQQIGDLDSRLNALAEIPATLSVFDRRLTDLENRPIPDIGATQEAVAAYERELTAMRAMLAEELDRIRAQSQQTADLAERAVQADQNSAARVISADLQAAIEAGRPVGPMLAALGSEGLNVPQFFSENTAALPSLGGLQASLSDVARAVVAEDVRARAQSGEMGRVEAFFRLQLGARSLATGDGDTAEAIFARAEDKLGRGDVAAALDEVERLGNDAGGVLSEWITSAQLYLNAMNAAAGIAAQTK